MWKTKVLKRHYFEKVLISFTPEGSKTPRIDIGWVDGYMQTFRYENLKPSAYMELPKVITKEPHRWKSVYLGDEEPKKGMYLLSMKTRSGHEYVTYQYYNPNKYKCEYGTEVMGWCVPPKPYKGEVSK